ncbi:MAG: lysozyme inhibitor LprI family protein [Bdellovibrionales bacterium]
MIRVFAVLILGFMTALPCAFAADPALGACKTVKNSMDEVACAKEKYDQSVERLNGIYDSIQSSQSEQHLGVFRNAQQRWIAYRDDECAWEASGGGGESLNRFTELECLIGVTNARSDALQKFYIPMDADQVLDENPAPSRRLIESPRWLNALSDSYPDVFWQYSKRFEADLNCDERPVYIIPGVRFGDQPVPVFAIADNPALGLPQSALFDVMGDEAQICDTQSQYEIVETASKADDSCFRRLRISNPSCGVFDFYRQGSGYILESPPDHNAIEPSVSQEP